MVGLIIAEIKIFVTFGQSTASCFLLIPVLMLSESNQPQLHIYRTDMIWVLSDIGVSKKVSVFFLKILNCCFNYMHVKRQNGLTVNNKCLLCQLQLNRLLH